MTTEDVREQFELWLEAQFGNNAPSVEGWDDDDGYPHETTNTFWVGFAAGFFLAE